MHARSWSRPSAGARPRARPDRHRAPPRRIARRRARGRDRGPGRRRHHPRPDDRPHSPAPRPAMTGCSMPSGSTSTPFGAGPRKHSGPARWRRPWGGSGGVAGPGAAPAGSRSLSGQEGPRARLAGVLALHHRHIGPEHILLALLREGRGLRPRSSSPREPTCPRFVAASYWPSARSREVAPRRSRGGLTLRRRGGAGPCRRGCRPRRPGTPPGRSSAGRRPARSTLPR